MQHNFIYNPRMTTNNHPEDTLNQWIAQAAEVRERMLAGGGKPGLAKPADVAGKTGMETMQAMLSGAIPYPHIAETLDLAD